MFLIWIFFLFWFVVFFVVFIIIICFRINFSLVFFCFIRNFDFFFWSICKFYSDNSFSFSWRFYFQFRILWKICNRRFKLFSRQFSRFYFYCLNIWHKFFCKWFINNDFYIDNSRLAVFKCYFDFPDVVSRFACVYRIFFCDVCNCCSIWQVCDVVCQVVCFAKFHNFINCFYCWYWCNYRCLFLYDNFWLYFINWAVGIFYNYCCVYLSSSFSARFFFEFKCCISRHCIWVCNQIFCFNIFSFENFYFFTYWIVCFCKWFINNDFYIDNSRLAVFKCYFDFSDVVSRFVCVYRIFFCDVCNFRSSWQVCDVICQIISFSVIHNFINCFYCWYWCDYRRLFLYDNFWLYFVNRSVGIFYDYRCVYISRSFCVWFFFEFKCCISRQIIWICNQIFCFNIFSFKDFYFFTSWLICFCKWFIYNDFYCHDSSCTIFKCYFDFSDVVSRFTCVYHIFFCDVCNCCSSWQVCDVICQVISFSVIHNFISCCNCWYWCDYRCLFLYDNSWLYFVNWAVGIFYDYCCIKLSSSFCVWFFFEFKCCISRHCIWVCNQIFCFYRFSFENFYFFTNWFIDRCLCFCCICDYFNRFFYFFSWINCPVYRRFVVLFIFRIYFHFWIVFCSQAQPFFNIVDCFLL